MKILHTSDWHIGRTFHTHSTLEHLGLVLDALVAVVAERAVDVVAVAGDVFDSAMPSRESYALLTDTLRRLKEAGASVVMTSGNHDSATRLGFQSEWAALAGIHVVTRPEQYTSPVTITDEHGPVHFYGIPYLEPALIRHLHPGVSLKTHEQVLDFAMTRIRDDLALRRLTESGGRSVVLSHCFAAGVAPAAESSDVERDITAGGLDVVPLGVFDGCDYVALGHIHGRATLTQRVRYSGAPLHYSFAEASKPRGAWLVELEADGLGPIEWVDLPVPRRLAVLTGELADLLADEAYADNEGDWVKAIITDQVRPLDAMRALHSRFAHAVALEHRPAITVEADGSTYAERIRAATGDPEIVAGFLAFVRNGVGPSEFERALVAELLAEQNATEVNA
ncbi:exonuclease subunit SbcD [Cryobacterium suzukii]|uniref:Nuclease SbcCD subunit D n=1 Tax=Cryobacterium suzukii TaxID=1259198 RepID=A0A4R9ACA5_9MICO|nr:exonuclease SbcCD subunit D C-terminal domain-containing protein [Cryobacterium suzukii]TFD57186.1 exonuclease subunit SbcD [Cryobacterium suzukii]